MFILKISQMFNFLGNVLGLEISSDTVFTPKPIYNRVMNRISNLEEFILNLNFSFHFIFANNFSDLIFFISISNRLIRKLFRIQRRFEIQFMWSGYKLLFAFGYRYDN